MKTALVFGAYGTFGKLVAADLIARGIPTILLCRSPRTPENPNAPQPKFIRADVSKKSDCLAAIRSVGEGRAVAVNCAGPFANFGTALLEACLETNTHYCDICDDRAYFQTARAMAPQFETRGLTALSGCASLPAISGALALHLLSLEKNSLPPERARATLFIGNKNPKGLGAVSSAMSTLGQPFQAPQGILRGFYDGETIPIPPPFGARKAYNFNAPEYDLFPSLLGVKSVSVKAGFELRAVGIGFNLLARLPFASSAFVGYWAYQFGKLTPPIGCSGGAIVTELFWADGKTRVAAIATHEHGQRMAVLPCVYAAQALCADTAPAKLGAPAAYEFVPGMLEKLEADGNGLWVDGILRE